MRALLQFLGFASATVCSTMFAGIVFTTSALGDAVSPSFVASCTNNCQCNTNRDGCVKFQSSGIDCASDCFCSNSNGNYICKPN
jgi:hypothetical protein